MKKKFITPLLILIINLTTSLSVSANQQSDSFVPYVGADAQWRHMEFKKGFGKDQVKSNYPQGNVYLGLKLNQYVGLEAGYEQTTTVKKNTNVLGSDVTFGTVFFPGGPNTVSQFNTKTKLRAFHANVVGFLPISEQYCLQLIGSLGVARIDLNTVLEIPVADNVALSAADAAALSQVFAKKKWVPKIGVGVQHMLTCQLGVRAMASWEGTRMNLNLLNSENVLFTGARVKDSINLGLGLFYNFK